MLVFEPLKRVLSQEWRVRRFRFRPKRHGQLPLVLVLDHFDKDIPSPPVVHIQSVVAWRQLDASKRFPGCLRSRSDGFRTDRGSESALNSLIEFQIAARVIWQTPIQASIAGSELVPR
jgi:hypothetical protein